MPKATVIEADVWRAVSAKINAKRFNWTSQKVKIEMDFPKDLYNRLDDDPLLQAKLWEAASDEYKSFIDDVIKSFKLAEKELDKLEKNYLKIKLADVNKTYSTLRKEIEAHQASLEKAVPEAVNKAWAALQKKTKRIKHIRSKQSFQLDCALLR